MFSDAAGASSRAARAMVCSVIYDYALYPCILQPILQIMLHKALQAHSQLSESHEVDSQPDDELSLFAGQTRLVSPEQPFTSPAPTPKPRQPQSKPTLGGQHGIYSPQLGSSDHHLLPHEPLPNKQVFLPDNYLDNFQATFSDLSGGWDGLFHEVPQPSYAFAPNSVSHTAHPSGEGAMLGDRWSSFMHNYNILTETSHRNNPPC
jgi:hypothetical protein